MITISFRAINTIQNSTVFYLTLFDNVREINKEPIDYNVSGLVLTSMITRGKRN